MAHNTVSSQSLEAEMSPLCKTEYSSLFASHSLRKPFSKQRLAHWLVEAIEAAYKAAGVAQPGKLRAHSTTGVFAFWATWKGAALDDIWRATSWASGDGCFLKP